MRFGKNKPTHFGRCIGTAALAGALNLVCGLQAASAGDFGVGIGYLGVYSDNIDRINTNPRYDWVNAAVAGIGYRESGRYLTARLRAQAQYQQYYHETYPDETLYFVDASAIWNMVPRFLSWTLQDRYDQIVADVAEPNTPANRLNINIFSTGPDINLRLGHVNTIVLGARYGNVIYGDRLNDQDRYGAYTRWIYLFSHDLQLSANYQYEDIRYSDPVTQDNYQRQDLFARIDWRRVRTQLLIDAGATRIEQDRGPGDEGPSLRFNLVQHLNPQATVGVLLASEFLDAGLALLSTTTAPGEPAEAPPPPPPPPPTADGVADFYYVKRAEGMTTYHGSNLLTEFRVFYREIDYQVTDRDREESGVRIEFTGNPSGTLVPAVFYQYTKVRFQEFMREDGYSDGGVRLVYRSTRNLSTTLEYHYRHQNSTDPLHEFTENTVSLAILYSSNPEIATVVPRQR